MKTKITQVPMDFDVIAKLYENIGQLDSFMGKTFKYDTAILKDEYEGTLNEFIYNFWQHLKLIREVLQTYYGLDKD